MKTAIKFSVSWCIRGSEGKSVRRTLFHTEQTACVEAAQLISNAQGVFDVEVFEVDTGKPVDWMP